MRGEKKYIDEVEKVHKEFLNYNHLIDHILLNTGTKEELVEQMNNLINFYQPQPASLQI